MSDTKQAYIFEPLDFTLETLTFVTDRNFYSIITSINYE